MSTELFFVLFDSTQNIVGLGYPIWRSYKVLEAKKFDNELIQWLTFWVIVSFLSQTEDLLRLVYLNLKEYFIYKLIRLVFVVWMIHPRYQGALYLYFAKIEKFFRCNEETIRRNTSKLLTVIPQKVKHYLNRTVIFLVNKGKRKHKHHKQTENII